MARVKIWNPRAVAESPIVSKNQLQHRSPQANPGSGRAELLAQIRELRKENDQLQDQLDKIANLADAPDDQDSETIDDLKEKLNRIADTAAPTDDEGDDSDDGDEDDYSGND